MTTTTQPTEPTVRGCDAHGEHSIELDCAPGMTRPWHLIDGVLKGTGLTTDLNRDDNHPFTFFGCARWEFEVTCEAWDKAQRLTKARITSLYNQHVIRYGSW